MDNLQKSALGGGKNTHHRERYEALDGLRALACICIVLMHVKASLAVKPTISFLTSNVISFAGDFVLLFMMVSAFSMSCGYYEQFRTGSIKTNDFYKKRYTRIMPFFAVLVALDTVNTIVEQHFAFTNALKAELWEAFADLTLLFGLAPGNGIEVVGVGWFLGVIFVFYLIYPFFTWLLSSKKMAWVSLAISVVWYYALKCYFGPEKGVVTGNTTILGVMPYLLVGGIIYLYREKVSEYLKLQEFKWAMTVVAMGYTVWFFVCPEMRFEFANLIMYALWTIYAIAETSTARKWCFLNNKVMALLSGISMEIYLCHMFVFRIVEKVHLEKHIANPDFGYWMICVLVLCGAISFALVWKKVEKKIIK